MMLNIANRHPAGVKRNDHVVEPAQAPRALGDQRRGETAVTIAWDRQTDIADLTGHRLGREAITGIRQFTPNRITLLIPEMIGQLGSQTTLQHRLDHLRQKPALTGQLQLTRIDLGQHVIKNARGLQRLYGVSTRHRLVSGHIHRYCSIHQEPQLHKPSDTPQDRVQHSRTRSSCAELGWEYQEFTTVDRNVERNLRLVSGYSHPRFAPTTATRETVAAELDGAADLGLRLDDLINTVSRRTALAHPVVVCAVYHMLWQRELHADLNHPLTWNTAVHP